MTGTPARPCARRAFHSSCEKGSAPLAANADEAVSLVRVRVRVRVRLTLTLTLTLTAAPDACVLLRPCPRAQVDVRAQKIELRAAAPQGDRRGVSCILEGAVAW